MTSTEQYHNSENHDTHCVCAHESPTQLDPPKRRGGQARGRHRSNHTWCFSHCPPFFPLFHPKGRLVVGPSSPSTLKTTPGVTPGVVCCCFPLLLNVNCLSEAFSPSPPSLQVACRIIDEKVDLAARTASAITNSHRVALSAGSAAFLMLNDPTVSMSSTVLKPFVLRFSRSSWKSCLPHY